METVHCQTELDLLILQLIFLYIRITFIYMFLNNYFILFLAWKVVQRKGSDPVFYFEFLEKTKDLCTCVVWVLFVVTFQCL